MEETVSVHVPGASIQFMQVLCRPDEGDDEIALKLSLTFRPGTVLGISGGTKWRINGPENVALVNAPKMLAPSKDRPQVGQTWRPKDPRRKASFTIVGVSGGEVRTDDGRTIQLARMSRYVRVS